MTSVLRVRAARTTLTGDDLDSSKIHGAIA